MTESKICPYCGKRFKLTSPKKKYCSRKCYLKHYWIKKRLPKKYSKETKKCIVCGKIFEKGFNFGNAWNKKQTCSRSCTNKKNYLVWKKRNPYIPKERANQKGSNSPTWKGGKIIDYTGYIRIKNHNHPFSNSKGQNYMFEHRLVMEKWLRENKPDSEFLVELDGEKYLKPEVIVHHIDSNRSNNNIKNLLCFNNKKEHISFHKKLSWFYENLAKDILGGDIYEIQAHFYNNTKLQYC